MTYREVAKAAWIWLLDVLQANPRAAVAGLERCGAFGSLRTLWSARNGVARMARRYPAWLTPRCRERLCHIGLQLGAAVAAAGFAWALWLAAR